MGLLDECKEHFGTSSLYEVFHIEKTAKPAEVKKAYYKLSMLHHPDKVTDETAKTESTHRFQIISKIYDILSDSERRKIYDETGLVDDENVLSDEDAINAWRKIFKKVTLEDIEKFCAEYKGSKEETNDIIEEYNRWCGDMTKIMDSIIGTNFGDEERIKSVIDDLIESGRLKSTKKYKSSTSKAKVASRARAAKKEAKEAEEALAEIQQKEGKNDLQALILKRQADRGASMDNFFDSLADKYAPNKKTKKAK